VSRSFSHRVFRPRHPHLTYFKTSPLTRRDTHFGSHLFSGEDGVRHYRTHSGALNFSSTNLVNSA
jgi:hypothetical protein